MLTFAQLLLDDAKRVDKRPICPYVFQPNF